MKTFNFIRPEKLSRIAFMLVSFLAFYLPASSSYSVPGSFEAEDYSDMSGIIEDPTTDGMDPGCCIALIEEGDRVEYPKRIHGNPSHFRLKNLTVKQ